jgi:ribosome-binding protein aMBF1 (putative translation factor)
LGIKLLQKYEEKVKVKKREKSELTIGDIAEIK